MPILRRKIFREIKRSKLRSSIIIIALALSIAIYAGFMLGYKNIDASLKKSEEVTSYEDFRVVFDNYSSISTVTTPDIKEVVNTVSNYDYRIWKPSALRLGNEDFTAYIHGVPGDRRPRVNDIYLVEGEYFTSYNATEVLVEVHFADSQHLDVGDKLELFSGTDYREYTIKGIVWSAEYTYVTNRLTLIPDWENLGAVWIPITQSQALFGLGDVFNELLVRVDSDKNLDSTIDAVQARYDPENLLISSITKKEDEPDSYMKNQDAGFLDDMGIIFGFMVLVVAIFVIWDTVSKIVESQRNYIGVMSALGGNKWKIVFHYVGYALVLGVIASGIGLIFSFLLAEIFMEAYRGVLKIPIADRDIAAALPYFGVAIGIALGLTVLVSFLSALRAANITPREAMSSAYVQQVYSDKSMLERAFTKIPGFRSLAIRIPIRSILRNKRRSFLTFLTYGISMLIVFGSLGFVESFLYQLDYYYTDLEKQDIAVYMLDPMNDTELSSQLEALGNVTQADPFVHGGVIISHSRSNRSTEIYGYSDTDLRSFNTKNSKSIEPGFIYLGSILAKRLGANIGSSVEIHNETFRVGDILQELMDQNAVMHFETAQKLFGLENLANGALVKVSGDIDDAKKEILTSGLPVSFLLVKSEIHSSIMHLMEGVMGIFIVVILLGFIVLALFSFNTVVMDVMSRELEFVNFRTLGSKKRTLYKVIGTQGAAIALLGTLIGIPIGYLGIAQFNMIVEDVMYVQTYISPLSILVTIIVGLLASQVGVWAAVRHVNRLNLVDVTRNRVNT